jgi:hypothetical protein
VFGNQWYKKGCSAFSRLLYKLWLYYYQSDNTIAKFINQKTKTDRSAGRISDIIIADNDLSKLALPSLRGIFSTLEI